MPADARNDHGLLTPANSVVAFLDMQPHLLAASMYVDRQALLHRNLMLARAARLFNVPRVRSCMAADTGMPQLDAVFADLPVMQRTTLSCWDDSDFVAAVAATGRHKLILAGFCTATCMTLPALQALGSGYDVYVVEDCCADASQLAHDSGMQRMILSGVRPVLALPLMCEWQRDWAWQGPGSLPGHDTGTAALDIARTHGSASDPLVDYLAGVLQDEMHPVFPGYVAPATR